MADENNPFILSLNGLSDPQLKSFVDDPNTFLGELKGTYVVPSIISPQTNNRIRDIMINKGLTAEDIAKNIDLMAMIKIKDVEIIS